jgi:hypothetical protein
MTAAFTELLLVTLCLCQAELPAPTEIASTWEYRVLKKDEVVGLGKNDLAAGLNALGNQGWELAAVDTAYIFKRLRNPVPPNLFLRNLNRNHIQDLKDQITILQSDVDRWKDRVGWSERMLSKGFLSHNQVLDEQEWLRRAELALERAQRELKALQPETGGKPAPAETKSNPPK